MKNTFLFLALLVLNVTMQAQNSEQNTQTIKDSTKLEILDEVLVKSVRVDADSPITHTNVTKEDLEIRNLGQDIPILLNYLPSVVTTSDAGAGIGYTGLRIRGVSGGSTNVTINGIAYNDAESLGTFWVNLPDFSSSIESLQVQRGVGSSTNGSGAFGASINILTNNQNKEASASTSHSAGSFGTVKNNVQFQKSRRYGDFVSARYSFYANRYDYLRIAKTMMDDWHNDTCAGKYLKTIYENRIKKKDNTKEADEYSVKNPATRVDSSSGKSKGNLFVSARAEMKKTTNIGSRGIANHTVSCASTIFDKLRDPTQSNTVIITNPIETSYDTIWAAERNAPRKGYCELLAQPAIIIP